MDSVADKTVASHPAKRQSRCGLMMHIVSLAQEVIEHRAAITESLPSPPGLSLEKMEESLVAFLT